MDKDDSFAFEPLLRGMQTMGYTDLQALVLLPQSINLLGVSLAGCFETVLHYPH